MAQKRRKELQMKRRQRRITALCIAGSVGAMLLSLLVCVLIFDPFPKETAVSAPVSTALPYDASAPFTLSDLTTAQVSQLRAGGRMSVSDGPRGVSIGDSLEELLERFPTTFTDKQTTGEQTGLQSDEEIILYCDSYFENQNGVMTALPPRGLLTVDGGEIIVTLLAPTGAYPAGTLDNYGSYEHVYCIYTIEAENMTVSSITLGIDQ